MLQDHDQDTPSQDTDVSQLPDTDEIPLRNADTGNLLNDEDKTKDVTAPVKSRNTQGLHTPFRIRQHMILYLRRMRAKRQRQSTFAVARLLLVSIMLFGVIAPTALTLSYSLRLYGIYSTLRTNIYDGIQHLMTVKELVIDDNNKTKTKDNDDFDPTTLVTVKAELGAARTNFVEVRTILKQTDVFQLVAQVAPQSQPYLTAAEAGSQIAIDATDIGLELTNTGLTLAPNFKGGILSEDKKPLVTSKDLTQIDSSFKRIVPLLDNIYTQSQLIPLDILPIEQSQRVQIRQYIQMFPQIMAILKMEPSPIYLLSWLMGVDQPRNFLVQTMDRGELRATGGFTGQYGELTVNGGRISPFTLRNIALLEYADDSQTYGDLAPEAYRSWWPFANWGLRDSNLSADFPTSARFALERYEHDTKRKADGVISFTPFLIKHVLKATGPILVPRYNETVTTDNLEEKLHFYQLSKPGIIKSKQIEGIDDDEQARKMFTTALTKTLMEHMKDASPKELLALGKQMLSDLQTRDLQIYFANPTVQEVLERYKYAGQMDRSLDQDGLYIVQTNVSVSKASEYVSNTFTDNITIDKTGGATHNLTMKFDYQKTGPVYGFDTYRNYIRVYVPPSARLLSGSGFDSGEALCGGPNLAPCTQQDFSPQGELTCPPGGYDAGPAAYMLDDPYLDMIHPLNKLGPPTNQKSDEPKRGMFAGYIVIPKDCTLTAKLSWYVPKMTNGADNKTTNGNYSLRIQRQAATFPTLNLAIQCQPNPKNKLNNQFILEQDTTFILGQKCN